MIVTPDLVVVGHVTIDLAADGRKLGGAASYGSLAAARLGLRTALVTCAGQDLDLAAALPDVQVSRTASDCTTIFEHAYAGDRRLQHVRHRAAMIEPADVPQALRVASLVLLAPVIGEVDPAIASIFPQALVCAAVQGWLRRLRADGFVEEGHTEALDVAALAGRVSAIVLSEEDLAGRAVPGSWLEAFPIIIVSRGREGLCLRYERRWWRLAAFAATEHDPTGAGDVLAAAFLVRYGETSEVGEAVRFAAAAASLSIEARGLDGVPSRAAVERRLAEQPSVQLIAEP